MECPQCGWVRSKKAWRSCQWYRQTHVSCDFRCCKVCDGDMYHHDTWHWRPEMQKQTQSDHKCRSRSPRVCVRQLPTSLRDIPQEAFQLQEMASLCDSCTLGDFVMQWMSLARSTRKLLSHNGAVQSRLGDPCHYTCPDELVHYFDPTNMIYSAALSIMAPNFDIETNWNAETRGDICESIMGFAYMSRTKRISCERWEASQQMSKIVDAFSWLTYHLHTKTGGTFPMWVKWIKDTAAWRKCQVVDDASHQNLQAICAEHDPSEPPRQKMGVLHTGLMMVD